MIEQLKQIQRGFFDDKGLSDFEITRPHGTGKLYEFLIDYKMQTMSRLVGTSFPGQKLLNVCCGSGMEAEYIANLGTNLFGLDLSLVALQQAKERVRRFGFNFKTIEGDAENLPFKAGSFGFVFVHDGLHHLDNPKKAVKEMARLAKKGVVIIEPAKALITELSILLGVSFRYEGSDFVYRFKKDELTSWLKEFGIKKALIKRYIMYYPHKPGRFFRIFDNSVLFYIVKKIFQVINFIFGRLGNKIQVVGLK